MPFLLLEGNDGAGKSSLTEEIARMFSILPMEEGEGPRVNIQHVGPPQRIRPDQTIREYADQERKRLMDMITCYDPEDINTLYIYDRFHSGSAAYGPLFRKGANMDEDFGQLGAVYFEDIEIALAERGAVSAYLMPSVDTIFERTAGEEDEFLDDAAGTTNAVQTARRELEKAFSDLTDAQANGASPATNACFHKVARAEQALTEARNAADEARRGQLSAIQQRYSDLLTKHRGVLHSYVGHPLYVPADAKDEAWPDISTSTNMTLVALYLLEEALTANDRILEGLRLGQVLPPCTPVVDENGASVTIPVVRYDVPRISLLDTELSA